MLAIEARHFPRRLSVGRPLFQVEPFVARLLALRHSDLGFDSPVFPIELQDDERPARDVRQAIEFVDLAAVEEELAHALRGRNFVARALIGLDVGAVEKGFAFFDPGEGVADIGFAGADRFDLAALQFDPGLVALEDVKIAERLAIEKRSQRAWSARTGARDAITPRRARL